MLWSISIFLGLSIWEVVCGQNIIGNNCTLEVSGSPGKCKLITKCKKVRDELVQYNRLPQACGFVGTQTIVCCPKKIRPDVSKKSGYFKRLAGGEKASRKEFPYLAQLGFRKKSGETVWACTGTIITEEHILTTAYCLKSLYGGPKFVRVGFTNIDDTEHRQEVKVVDTIVHPDYEESSPYHDLGLVKLEKPIHFNSYALPACLHTKFQNPGNKAITAGWGVTERGFSPKDLFKVRVELSDYESCSSKNRNGTNLGGGIVDKEQICIADNVPKDTCAGDPGGPLQALGYLCMYHIIGVTSFGPGSCGTSTPSVYTRVSHYVEWIDDIVSPLYANHDFEIR